MYRIVVYIDIVFLVNFVLDFILLVITDGFLKNSATYFRIAIAAAVGAVWACIAETGIIGNVLVKDIFTYFVISAVMAGICAGRCTAKKLVKSVFTLIAVSSFIGGMAGMLYWHTAAGYYVRTAAVKSSWLFVSLMLSLMAVTVVLREYIVRRTYADGIYNVRIDFGEISLEVKGMADTGNVLTDNVTAKPVHIIDRACLGAFGDNIFKGIPSVCMDIKLHYVPFSSVGCREGCIAVAVARSMCIEGNRDNKNGRGNAHNSIYLENVPIGISMTPLSQDGVYQMLINGAVFNSDIGD